jgi:hypothetical protein
MDHKLSFPVAPGHESRAIQQEAAGDDGARYQFVTGKINEGGEQQRREKYSLDGCRGFVERRTHSRGTIQVLPITEQQNEACVKKEKSFIPDVRLADGNSVPSGEELAQFLVRKSQCKCQRAIGDDDADIDKRIEQLNPAPSAEFALRLGLLRTAAFRRRVRPHDTHGFFGQVCRVRAERWGGARAK